MNLCFAGLEAWDALDVMLLWWVPEPDASDLPATYLASQSLLLTRRVVQQQQTEQLQQVTS